MRPMYVHLGVDVETDVGSFTPYYEGTRNGTPKLLDLFESHDISGTFYFTGECARDNPDVARRVAATANEIGCHSLFHETVGDELFPLPGIKPLLPHEVKPRLAMATDWVEEASGVRPISFRCPRLWGSTNVVNALEELGYVADATYPMYYYRERYQPYYPSRNDWTQLGDSRVLEIPNFADMSMESKDPGLERDRDQWPLFRTEGAEVMLERSRRFIRFSEERATATVLAFYLHPWEFEPMAREYHFGEATVRPDEILTQGCGGDALREMGLLIQGLLEMGAVFVTAKQLAGLALDGSLPVPRGSA